MAQNVSINIDGSAPDASAILDVKSTTKGFAPPRMTQYEMLNIAEPAAGLIVFNTTNKCLYYYDNTTWVDLQFCDCGHVVDVEGNFYRAVKVGDQCWMAENLKTTKYSDGTSILGVYDNGATYLENYGKVYTWAAVMGGSASSNLNPSGVQGVCPDGWHMPSDAEFLELENRICEDFGHTDCNTIFNGTNTGWLGHIESQGGSEARAMKEYNALWNGNSTNVNAGYNNSTDPSGFNALPGGNRHPSSGTYDSVGSTTYFWTTTQNNSNTSNAYFRGLYYNDSKINRLNMQKTYGISVRCIRD